MDSENKNGEGRNKPQCECCSPLSMLPTPPPPQWKAPGLNGGRLPAATCDRFLYSTYRSKSFLPILFLHMKEHIFHESLSLGGLGLLSSRAESVWAVRKARLQHATGDTVKLPDTPGTLALREATVQAFLTAQRRSKRASAHRSTPNEFAGSASTGKIIRGNKELRNPLTDSPNVFRAENVLIHKNCFFFITFWHNSFAE